MERDSARKRGRPAKEPEEESEKESSLNKRNTRSTTKKSASKNKTVRIGNLPPVKNIVDEIIRLEEEEENEVDARMAEDGNVFDPEKIKSLPEMAKFFYQQMQNLPTKSDIDRRIDRIQGQLCLLYTSPSPRDRQKSRMPSSA